MFYVTPKRLATLRGAPDLALSLALGCVLVVAWALAALSFRRAADAIGSDNNQRRDVLAQEYADRP